MGRSIIKGLTLTPLSIIETEGGDVLHAMKSSDIGFSGFGESYFATVEKNAVKGWKLHREMVLNLVVPVGAVKFVILDDRTDSKTVGNFVKLVLSRLNYGRLTVPPNLWFAFQGIDPNKSLLLNIANIIHDPKEVERKELNEIDFDWSIS